jgi:hypothetical protein
MKILNDIFKDIHQKEFFDNQFKDSLKLLKSTQAAVNSKS